MFRTKKYNFQSITCTILYFITPLEREKVRETERERERERETERERHRKRERMKDPHNLEGKASMDHLVGEGLG